MSLGLGLGISLWSNQAAVSGGGFTNLVTNGDFSSGSTGWTLWNSAIVVTGGQAVATGATNMLYQNVGFTPGVTYQISFTYTCTSGNSIRITTPASVTTGTALLTQSLVVDGAAHTFSGSFTATDVWLGIDATGAAFTGTIDNIVVHT